MANGIVTIHRPCPDLTPPAKLFVENARVGGSYHSATEDCKASQSPGTLPALLLPTDRPRPTVKACFHAAESILLHADCYAKLRDTSHGPGITQCATLVSTFATLMFRLTGQENFFIGIQAAAKTSVFQEESAGHSLDFVPLRINVDGSVPFRKFATEVSERIFTTHGHKERECGSQFHQRTQSQDTNRVPSVAVIFNIERSNSDSNRASWFEMDDKTQRARLEDFELFFNLFPTDENLTIECVYNADLHQASTIRRWLESYAQLIYSALIDTDAPVAALPMLGVDEKKLTLETWNATTRDYPRHATLHGLISSAATLSPSRVAIRCGCESLTYRELETYSNALASRLQAEGAKPGDLIGVHLERSCDIAPSLLAILKCGAAYVPLDPAYPAERLALMIENAEMRIILSQSSIHLALPTSEACIVIVDEPYNLPRPYTPVESSGEDTAYVIFTSGSTGSPKGVRVPHHAVVNLLNSMRREPGLSQDDVLLSVTTLSFDISGLEIFLPLTTGAEVVIAPRDTTLDGQLLSSAISDHNVTFLQATPVTWRLLLEAGWKGKSDLKALVGGESVPRELVNRLVPTCAEVWDVYGPTETTIWSTIHRLEAGEGPVFIGHPVNNTQVYIVNSAMQPQPIGIAGELVIGGDGLASGYHKLPKLTADRFVESPFREGAKLYRTGDLARWTGDGALEFLGRLDHQVKIRGFRIELEEIESLLDMHPLVEQAVVVANDDCLVAYLREPKAVAPYELCAGGDHGALDHHTRTHERGIGPHLHMPHDRGRAFLERKNSPTSHAPAPYADELTTLLRHHLSKRLPEYMIPSAFVTLEQFPLTPNGKVDRRALPASLSVVMNRTPRCLVAPRNETEKTLLEIWKEVLGRNDIGVEDDIFELGGDSIVIFQIINRATRKGLTVTPAQVFSSRNVAAIAVKSAEVPERSEASSIQRVNRDAYRRKT